MKLYTNRSHLSTFALPVWSLWTRKPREATMSHYVGCVMKIRGMYIPMLKEDGNYVDLPPTVTLRGARKAAGNYLSPPVILEDW